MIDHCLFPDRRVCGLRLQQQTSTDHPFLTALMMTCREAEGRSLGNAETFTKLMSMQVSAQTTHYVNTYPGANLDLLIDEKGAGTGKLYLARLPDEIRVLDIAVLHGLRNQGLGGRILTEVMNAAAALGLPVRLTVEWQNPARRLYDRLGFQAVGAQPPYVFMEWRVPADDAAAEGAHELR